MASFMPCDRRARALPVHCADHARSARTASRVVRGAHGCQVPGCSLTADHGYQAGLCCDPACRRRNPYRSQPDSLPTAACCVAPGRPDLDPRTVGTSCDGAYEMRKAIARLCDAEHGLMSATGRNVHSVLAARWFSARSTSLIIPMAVLAVAGIAGCGSVGTSGGAASLPPIAASGTASPAGRMHALPRRALSKLPKARHHVGLAPAVVDPVAFAHPELLTPIRDHEVHGSSVTAVGDSVMLGSEPALERRLPGIYVDAEVSRQFSVGLQAIAALASSGE